LLGLHRRQLFVHLGDINLIGDLDGVDHGGEDDDYRGG
jgi:hypothetical protein